jgi:HEPN domain-containing protein
MKLSKTVLQWIKFARTDLRIAKSSLELSSEFKSVAAFHAQQSAEKIIKAYLTLKKVRTPKSHDLELLVSEVAKVNPELAKLILQAKNLTIYAVTYRYPDAERKPLTISKVKRAIKIAEVIFQECLESMKK